MGAGDLAVKLLDLAHGKTQVILAMSLGIIVAASGIYLPSLSHHPDSASILTVTDLGITASPSAAYVGEEITFFANASTDVVGAMLTFTIFYDYLVKPYPTVNPHSAFTVIKTMTNPATIVTKHTYSTVGNYTSGGRYFFWVYVFVNDGTENITNYLQVRVNYNSPPQLISPPENPMVTPAGVQKNISILVADADSDVVNVHWNFGDGATADNSTVAPPFPPGVYVNVTHTWDPHVPGYGPFFAFYWLNISLSDGINSPVNYSSLVNVTVGVNWPPTCFVEASRTHAVIDSLNPTAQINFSANATDPEGEPLTWTFDYGDGSPIEVYHYTDWTTPGQLMWQNTSHTFSQVGNYTVNISVTDALVPNQIGYHNLTMSIMIRLTYNLPPYVADGIAVQGANQVLDPVIGYVDMIFEVEAFDPDGDVMNAAWSLDGGLIGTNLSAGTKEIYSFQQVIRFNQTGTFNVSVVVTDARPDHEQSRYRMVNILSNNLPPYMVAFNHGGFSLGDFGFPGEILTFDIVMTDPEEDTIELSVDFGDGTPMVLTNLSDYDPAGNLTIHLTHAYDIIGDFEMRINFTDNKLGILNHTVSFIVPISVRFALSLGIGWNMVSLPVWATYLASTIPGLTTGDVVVEWNSVTQTYDEMFVKGVSPLSMDFVLEPNKGYWVYSASAKSTSLHELPPTWTQSSQITVPDAGGWVLVGLCSMKSTLIAEDLAAMYVGANLSRVDSWNRTAGSYISHIVGDPLDEFCLIPGMGYWIYVDGSGTLVYDP